MDYAVCFGHRADGPRTLPDDVSTSFVRSSFSHRADIFLKGNWAGGARGGAAGGGRMKTGTGKYEKLLKRCAGLEPVPTAVAHPCEKSALAGAVEASEQGLIRPILVGPMEKIREVAKA